MSGRRGIGGTPATVALARAGVVFTLHPYAHNPRVSSYGDEAVLASGAEPDRVFKTLIVDLTMGAGRSQLVTAVVPVPRQLDLKALAAAMGAKKAALADASAAARSSGYVLGGISPFGQRTRLPTVVDASAVSCDTVRVSAGARGLQVEVAPADLIAVTAALVAAIAG